ncbi:MAG: hypothetical protein WAX07_01660 [Candidatus Altiarchaeia archaeon]
MTIDSGAAQANKVPCWTTTKLIGYCSSAVASDDSCTFNAIG